MNRLRKHERLQDVDLTNEHQQTGQSIDKISGQQCFVEFTLTTCKREMSMAKWYARESEFG